MNEHARDAVVAVAIAAVVITAVIVTGDAAWLWLLALLALVVFGERWLTCECRRCGHRQGRINP